MIKLLYARNVSWGAFLDLPGRAKGQLGRPDKKQQSFLKKWNITRVHYHIKHSARICVALQRREK